MIAILNYGMGNVGSIQNMFKKVGVLSTIVSDPQEISEANALVIPGVGHFGHAMQQLDAVGLHSALDYLALEKCIPILGICLGMQLMTRGSEEGQMPGLGWVPADTRKITGAAHGLRVPHMGWNVVNIRKSSACFDGDGITEHRFYFVHSYAVHCDDPGDVLATTSYAGEFVSAFERGNLLGVQFHPEKSHRFGMSFLKRFADKAQQYRF